MTNVYIEYFYNLVIPRVTEIVSTLWIKPVVLWAVVPLFITILLLQIYFGRYRTEELGWNTAFANTISLFWVSANLIRHLSENYSLIQLLSEKQLILKVVIVLVIALWAILLSLFNFGHLLSKSLSFAVSSSKVIMTTIIIITLIILGGIILDLVTFIASLLIFFITVFLLTLIKKLIVPSTGAKIGMKLHQRHLEDLKRRKREERERMIAQRKEKIKEFFKNIFHKFKKD